MKWSDKFSTGVSEIDEQHKTIFDWCTQVEEAADDQRMMTAAYSITRLMQYTRSHFTAEEKLMAECAYPRLEAHRIEHESFRRQLSELQAAALSGDISGATVMLLRDWLSKHIMVQDMDYVPYVRGISATEGGPPH